MESKIFSTRDLNLASVLVSLKHEFKRVDFQIEGSKGNTVGYFVFEESEKLKQDENNFWNRKVLISVNNLMDSVNFLKESLNSTKKKQIVDKTQFDIEIPTRNIELASAIVTKGGFLKNINYVKSGSNLVAYFDFDKNDNIDEIVDQYKNKKLEVEPQTYMMNYRLLKAQVNNALRNPHIMS